MKAIYELLACNIKEFEKRFKNLQKKADKIGVEKPIYKIIGEEYKTFQINERTKIKVLVKKVLIEGETPKYKGWSFIGIIQNRSDGLRVIKAVPDEIIPEKYRESGFYCDHCKTNRLRSKIYILKGPDEKTMQVGSTCIKDFLGGESPKQIAEYCSYLITANEGLENGYGSYGKVDYRFNIEDILAYTDEAIKKHGWVSKKREIEEMIQSTASFIEYILLSKRVDPKDKIELSQENYDNAKKAIEWAKTLNEKKKLSDYEYNVLQFVKLKVCGVFDFGIVCSIMATYNNYINELKKNKKEDSEYFGEKKKRYTFENVEITFVKYLDSEWGVTTLIKMITPDKNILVWFASGSIEIKVGEIVNIKGTVKGHKEYKGLKETILSRVTFLN